MKMISLFLLHQNMVAEDDQLLWMSLFTTCVCGNDTYIFIGDLQEGVEVLNNSNPVILSEIASYVATPHDIEFNENYIYVADQDNGFLLLELSSIQGTNTPKLNTFNSFLLLPVLGIIVIFQIKSRRK
ncbi:MAG: hypothetical protein FK730_09135 [Asgard group archaeon]|nr:hypothetical protein [Asgard group archaeon]